MATSNFYQDGNHGLNVIIPSEDDELDTTVEDTLINIKVKRLHCQKFIEM